MKSILCLIILFLGISCAAQTSTYYSSFFELQCDSSGEYDSSGVLIGTWFDPMSITIESVAGHTITVEYKTSGRKSTQEINNEYRTTAGDFIFYMPYETTYKMGRYSPSTKMIFFYPRDPGGHIIGHQVTGVKDYDPARHLPR